MTSLFPRAAIVSGAAALVVLGAGCGTAPTERPPLPPESTASSTAPSADAVSSTGSVKPVAPASALPEGWRKQVNAAAGYSFAWPPTGKYAPTWDVLQVKDGSASMKDGCYAPSELGTERKPSQRITVGDAAFCQTSFGDAGAGQYYTTDFFAVKNGSLYTVLKMQKHLTNAGMTDCPNKEGYLVKQGTCNRFEESEYQELLQQMVGTFAWTK
jgi:hypothetical protein